MALVTLLLACSLGVVAADCTWKLDGSMVVNYLVAEEAGTSTAYALWLAGVGTWYHPDMAVDGEEVTCDQVAYIEEYLGEEVSNTSAFLDEFNSDGNSVDCPTAPDCHTPPPATPEPPPPSGTGCTWESDGTLFLNTVIATETGTTTEFSQWLAGFGTWYDPDMAVDGEEVTCDQVVYIEGYYGMEGTDYSDLFAVLELAGSYVDCPSEPESDVCSSATPSPPATPTPSSPSTTPAPTPEAETPCADDDATIIALASSAGLTIPGCAFVQSYCEHPAYGNIVQSTCPATCDSCTEATSAPTPSPTSACADDNARMIALASNVGFTISGCANVLSFCQDAAYGSIVQATCPATCGSC